MTWRQELISSAILFTAGCTDLVGGDELTFDVVPDATCEHHRDCPRVAFQGPAVCQEGQCVPLATEECPLVLGENNLRSDVPSFLFGAFSAVERGEEASSVATKNFELAVREFTEEGGVMIGGETHLPVAVLCDALGATQDELNRGFDHLVDDLGITSVISTLHGAELKRSFERVYRTKGKDVFFLSPFESDALLTTVDDGGRLWQLLSSSTEVAPAYLPTIQRVEAYLSRTRDGDGEPIRLALFDTSEPRQSNMADIIHDKLMLNGQRAADSGPQVYRRYTLDVRPHEADVFVDLAEFRPHIIVSTAGADFLDEILAPVEAGWDSLGQGQPPPFYVLSPDQAGSLLPLRDFIAVFPTLRERLVGVNVAAAEDLTLYSEYLARLRSAYFDAPGLEGTENYYDAVYFLLYAATAAGRVPDLRGGLIAAGMSRLVDPAALRFDVGPRHIAKTVAFLNSPGTTIALHGTLGPPDFDLATGARHGAGSVWCIQSDDSGGTILYDVLRYDRATGSLHGEFPCFEGF